MLTRRRQEVTAKSSLSASSFTFQFSLLACVVQRRCFPACALTLTATVMLRPIYYAVRRPVYLISAFCTHHTLFRCKDTHATLHCTITQCNVADLYTTYVPAGICTHMRCVHMPHMQHDFSCTTIDAYPYTCSFIFSCTVRYCTLNTHDRIAHAHAHHSSYQYRRARINCISISSHTSPFGRTERLHIHHFHPGRCVRAVFQKAQVLK